jgi:large subunit ribosomal protein L9
MEIILLEKIQNVGDIGDLASVKNGYARNFLIPQKKAMLATADAKAVVEEKRRQLAEDEAGRLAAAQARSEKSVKEIHLVRLCGEEGQLYGSVSPLDIAEAMTAKGSEIEKSEVTQPDGPIKHVGEFEADVILHPEVRFTVKIVVEGEKGDGNPVDSEVAPAISEETE